MVIIIDGYNVLHTIDPGDISRDELEGKRQALVEEIISFTASTGDEAIIVFDSGKAESPERLSIPRTAVTVWYSSATMIADILIGKLVQEKLASVKADIKVVSADWEVQKGALMKRVERIPPRHFLAEMKKFEKKVANSSKMDRMHGKLEDKVDVETLRKLEEMRRGRG